MILLPQEYVMNAIAHMHFRRQTAARGEGGLSPQCIIAVYVVRPHGRLHLFLS